MHHAISEKLDRTMCIKQQYAKGSGINVLVYSPTEDGTGTVVRYADSNSWSWNNVLSFVQGLIYFLPSPYNSHRRYRFPPSPHEETGSGVNKHISWLDDWYMWERKFQLSSDFRAHVLQEATLMAQLPTGPGERDPIYVCEKASEKVASK